MGLNSVAVILNDFHGNLKQGGKVGEEIARAISYWGVRDREWGADRFTGGHLISMSHADYPQVVVVHRNTGGLAIAQEDLPWMALDQMAQCLRKHGWTAKEPAKPRKGRKPPA